jgi:hypothetical protein
MTRKYLFMPPNIKKPIFKRRREQRFITKTEIEIHLEERNLAEEKATVAKKDANRRVILSWVSTFSILVLTSVAAYFVWVYSFGTPIESAHAQFRQQIIDLNQEQQRLLREFKDLNNELNIHLFQPNSPDSLAESLNAVGKRISTLEELNKPNSFEGVQAPAKIDTELSRISDQVDTIKESYQRITTQLSLSEQRLTKMEHVPQSAVPWGYMLSGQSISWLMVIWIIVYSRRYWLPKFLSCFSSQADSESSPRNQPSQNTDGFSKLFSIITIVVTIFGWVIPNLLNHYLIKSPEKPFILILSPESNEQISPAPNYIYVLQSSGREYKMFMSECIFEPGVSSISVTAKLPTANKECLGLQSAWSNLRDNLCQMARDLEEEGFNELLVIGQHDSSDFGPDSKKFNQDLADERAQSVKALLEEKEICGLDDGFEISTTGSGNWFNEPNHADRRIYLIGSKNASHIKQ